MTHDKIAKNLLLDKTCDTCRNELYGRCLNYIGGINTCEEWTAYIFVQSTEYSVNRPYLTGRR